MLEQGDDRGAGQKRAEKLGRTRLWVDLEIRVDDGEKIGEVEARDYDEIRLGGVGLGEGLIE